VTGGNPNNNPFAVEGIVAEGITEQQQKDGGNCSTSLTCSAGDAGKCEFQAV